MRFDSWDTATLMALAEEKARRNEDGHFTLFRFTTQWKIMGGTPDEDVRFQLDGLIAFASVNSALVGYILDHYVKIPIERAPEHDGQA